MDFVIPRSLGAYYHNRVTEIAPALIDADVIVLSEPIGPAIADGMFQLLARRGVALPPLIRTETGGPLWTRYLRICNETLDQPGNPYFDPVGNKGYMPEDVKADFRMWLVQHYDLPEHTLIDAGLHHLLHQLAEIVHGIPERSVKLVVLAADPFMEEDSDPYVLDEIAGLFAPERPISWQHIGIMTVDWVGEIEAANPQCWPKSRQLSSLVERASYDPRSLQLNERPQLIWFLAELRSKLLAFSDV